MENTEVKGRISLLEALKKISKVKFDFQLVGHETTAPDKEGKTMKVLVMKLFNEIPYVRGSQKIPMEDGSLRSLELTNVSEVKIIETDADNAGFDMVVDEETGEVTGTYEGSDLVLDISKSNMDVWLRNGTFASSGKAIRATNVANRLQAVRDRLKSPTVINP